MNERDPLYWPDQLERTLRRYDEALLRQVAGRPIRPRHLWPRDELVLPCPPPTTALPSIERRLKDLEPGERQLLALIGHSRQPLWRLGNLVELMLSLGQTDGLRPVFALLESGLLYPWLPGEETESARRPALKSFEQWL